MTQPLLATRGLAKRYGGLVATDDVSIEVGQGTIHAIIGPNGAGKTTLMSLLSGELEADAGRVMFEGRDITAAPTYARILAGMGRSFQITSIFGELTVLENVALAVQARQGHSFRFFKDALGDDALNDVSRAILGEIGLLDRADGFAASLSHGEKRALEIGMGLAGSPKLLLLDEPMAGMGPEDSARMVKLLQAIRGRATILMVEHDMDAVFTLADHISVLVYGRVIASGEPQAIRRDEQVRRAYLGDGEA